MKKGISRKGITVIFLILIAIPINAQEDNLEFHSISFGGGFLTTPSKSSEGGLNWVADVATGWRKNIFSLYVNRGSGFFVGDWTSDDSEDYLEISLTYGREIKLLSGVKLEGHAGVGFFNHKAKYHERNIDLDKTTVGFPVRAKLIFYYKFIGIGINQNANFNPQVSTYSTDLVLQVIF